jgi:ABC-type transporter Mla MlaB component
VPDSYQTASSADVVDVRGANVPVHLDVSWLVPADFAAVDALARLQLAAARRGRSLRLHGADGCLVELVVLAGLCEVLGVCECGSPPTGPDEHPGD